MTYPEWKDWVLRIFGSEEAHKRSLPNRQWGRSWEEDGKWFSRARITDVPDVVTFEDGA